MIKRFRMIFFVLALLIGAQPFVVPFSQAAAHENQRLASLSSVAHRMGIDQALLLEPSSYQEQHTLLSEQRLNHAMAALDAEYGPSSAALARVKAEVNSIKDVHAASAFFGVHNTLHRIDQTVQRELATLGQHPSVDTTALQTYAILIDQSWQDLERLETQTRSQIEHSALAQQRLNTFLRKTRNLLIDVDTALDRMPAADASANEWQTYLVGVERAIEPIVSEPETGPAPRYSLRGLPTGPVQSAAEPLQSSSMVYLLEQTTANPVHLTALAETPADTLHTLLHMGGIAPDALVETNAPLFAAIDQEAALSTPAAERSIAQNLVVVASPTPEDYLETPDVFFTPDIDALVERFKDSNDTPDPVAIVNFVRNTIDSELYYGSKKGSVGTLYEQAGNDSDQASLLIALLRRAGIPARYARGTVWLSEQQAMDLTHTIDPKAAADVLTTAGWPATHLIRSLDGSIPSVVEFEHTWVQIYLPYERYRGVLEQDVGQAWIDVSPFIKTYRFNENPVDLQDAVPFDPDTYLNTDTPTLPLDYWQNQLNDYILSNDLVCETFESATRYRRIVPDNRKLLSAELPVRVINRLATFSALTGERYGIQVSMVDANGQPTLTAAPIDLPGIYGQRIDVVYRAATTEDQQIIDSYGSLYDTPPYLVNIRPVLRIDGEEVATGTSMTPGTEQEIVVDFTTPGVTSLVPSMMHAVEAGGITVVGLDYQLMPQQLIDEAREDHTQAVDSGSDQQTIEVHKLHDTILTYFREYNRGLNEVSGIRWHHYVRDIGGGFISKRLEVTTNFGGSPSTVAEGNYRIDIPKLSVTYYDALAQQNDKSREVAQLVGYHASALEHHVLQQNYGRYAVSAVKGLQYAASQGQTLQTITNAGQVAALQVSQEVKDTILDALNEGWIARAPQQPIAYQGWEGTGYILEDPTTGAGAYLIEGGANGGETGDVLMAAFSCVGLGVSSACGLLVDTIFDTLMNALSSIIADPVNVTNGNLLDQTLDLTYQARGIPLSFERWYNSLQPAYGDLGWGWTHTYDQRLEFQQDGSIIFADLDGKRARYTPDGNGGFIRPAGMQLELTQQGSTYTLTDLSQYRLVFDATTGQLREIVDFLGNALTLTYNGDRLSTVIDASGRVVLTFAYNSDGLIEQITDRDNRTVRYGYENGHLTRVWDVRDKLWQYTYDNQHRMTAKTDPLGNRDTFAYDSEGRMYRHVNALGEVESINYDVHNQRVVYEKKGGATEIFVYDERGRVVQHTDTVGNITTSVWDDDDNLREVVDPRGQKYLADYDDRGRLLSRTEPDGTVITYEHNAYGMPEKITTTYQGQTTEETFSYEPDGRLKSHTNQDGTILYTLNTNGEITRIEDQDGTFRIEYDFNGVGQVERQRVRVTDVDGSIRTEERTYTYGVGGLPDSITHGQGGVRYVLNNAGQPVEIRDNDNNLIAQATYDDKGMVTSIITQSGSTISLEFDSLGRLTFKGNSEGEWVRQSFNAQGRMIERTNHEEQTIRYEYDILGRKIRTIHPNGSVEGYGYCAHINEICKVIDANGNSYEVELDENDNITALTNGLGHTTVIVYNQNDNSAAMTDPEGHTHTVYQDEQGRIVRVVDALSHETTYNYAGPDSIAPQEIRDARTHSRFYDYDELGRLMRFANHLGDETRFYYDADGLLDRVVDGNNETVNYTFADGRLSQRSGPTGTDTFTYENGFIKTIANATAERIYDFDDLGQVRQIIQRINGVDRSVNYTYTPDGLLETLTDNEDQETRYIYDDYQQPIVVSHSAGGQATFAYDPGGRRISKTLPNGVTTFYEYDAANQLIAEVTHDLSGEPIAAYSYTYDKRGLRTGATDMNGRTITYRYDPIGRLERVDYGNGHVQEFQYDAVGNREQMVDGGATTTYAYNDANQLRQENRPGETITYNYDGNGSLIEETSSVAGTTTYSYNHFGQMTGIDLPDGSQWRFGYDANHSRVFEEYTNNGSTRRTEFLVSNYGVLTSYTSVDSVSTETTHYLHNPVLLDELLGFAVNGEWYYPVQDSMNSVVAITDAEGTVVSRRSYDAFGAVEQQTGTWNTPHGFTGREDIGETGLMHYRARTYDTSTGLFTTIDPVVAPTTLQEPHSFHQYIYALNDPINFSDPSGESTGFGPLDYLDHSHSGLHGEFVKYLKKSLWVDTAKSLLGIAFKLAPIRPSVAKLAMAALTAGDFVFTSIHSSISLVSDYGASADTAAAAQRAAVGLIVVSIIVTPLAAYIASTDAVAGYKNKPEEGWPARDALFKEISKKFKEVVTTRFIEFLLKAYILKGPQMTKDSGLGAGFAFGIKVLVTSLKWYIRVLLDAEYGKPTSWKAKKYLGKAAVDALKLTLSPEFLMLMSTNFYRPPKPPCNKRNARGMCISPPAAR